jgi:predicted nucleotidyltransferase
MLALIIQKQDELARICSRFGVVRLALFGSAAREDFEPAKSDLDFAVEFLQMSPDEHAHSYFGLLKALGELFDRKVDLVEVSAVRNPYIRRNIERSRILLYAA